MDQLYETFLNTENPKFHKHGPTKWGASNIDKNRYVQGIIDYGNTLNKMDKKSFQPCWRKARYGSCNYEECPFNHHIINKYADTDCPYGEECSYGIKCCYKHTGIQWCKFHHKCKREDCVFKHPIKPIPRANEVPMPTTLGLFKF